ncbi:MAG TPA: PLP-dependent aminotransferase family protein [Bryobacteraceae bacterium]|nr:PLP-dependent aminotransferase family protein [Bryobacteraceae bacterium]
MQARLMTEAAPDLISFALGLPAVELFPQNAFTEVAHAVLRSNRMALQYGPPCSSLKSQIVELMHRRGVDATEEQIYLTAGAQQGLSLLSSILLNPGDIVMLEGANYPGFMEALRPCRPRLCPVPTNLLTGIDVDAVQSLLEEGISPALLYVMTEAHNPMGVSISNENRERLVALAQRYGFMIVEDDAYGLLKYDGRPDRPLRAFDSQWVSYVGSFSKIVAPSLRVGWVVIPEELIGPFSIAKFGSDLDSYTLTQHLISAFLDEGRIWDHVQYLCDEYRRRRDIMLNSLAAYFPSTARWSCPSGGLFIWVELPEEFDTAALLPIAVQQQHVAYIPGDSFAVDRKGRFSNCLRLNFSNSPEGKIKEGVLRLSRIFKEGEIPETEKSLCVHA